MFNTLLAAEAQQPSIWSTIIIFAVAMLAMWLLFLRPQAKKAKEARKLLDSLEVGNEILLAGGLIGTVSKVKTEDDLITVNIAPNVDITTKRGFVIQILPNGTIASIMPQGKHKNHGKKSHATPVVNETPVVEEKVAEEKAAEEKTEVKADADTTTAKTETK